jgi:amidohydrolase
MHACGHDAHMTMVCGAGLLIRDLRPDLASGVLLLFQPAEEVPPGGAVKVLASKALEASNVSGIFGLHVDPRYPAGTLLLRKGALMAASDRFRLTIRGTGGHGGYPHLTVDPIVTAAQIVLALQTIVSRRVDPVEPAVITVGRIEGGTADNVIPGVVILSGTLRSHSPAVRRQLPEWIAGTASAIASSAGASTEFEYLPGHPGLSNDPEVIDFVEAAMLPILGADRLVALPKPIMGGEDFAHYLEALPGAFLRLGVRNEGKGCIHPIHSPKFNLDEDALAVGAAALAGVAIAWLESGRAGY